MPYHNASSSENIKKRKSYILLWIENNHYEILGRLLPGNKIQREFKWDDPLIQCIYTILCDPNKVPDQYPHLIPHLSVKIKEEIQSPQSPYVKLNFDNVSETSSEVEDNEE